MFGYLVLCVGIGVVVYGLLGWFFLDLVGWVCVDALGFRRFVGVGGFVVSSWRWFLVWF